MGRRNKDSNGIRYIEGESIGRLIAINEEIRDYIKIQTQQIGQLNAEIKSHDARLNDFKNEFKFLIKFVILPLLAGLIGFKIMEVFKYLP